jgi:hypothetical protein
MTAQDKLIEAINRQTAVLEGMPVSIGKEVAKWLIKADLPGIRKELRESVLLEMGFRPVEIVDLLYPNVGKTERRAKAKAISERIKT